MKAPREDLLEHAMGLFPPPGDSLERLTRRNRARVRNRRLGAGAVGVALMVAAVGMGIRVAREGQAPGETPTPTAAPTAESWSTTTTPPPAAIAGDANERLVDAVTFEEAPLPRNVAALSSRATAFQLSPDGTMIAFDGGAGIYVLGVDEPASKARLLTPDDMAYAADPRWSPDGSTIVFETGRPYDPQAATIAIVEVATGRTSPVTSAEGDRLWWPSFTPNGRVLVTIAGRSDGPLSVWELPPDGGRGRMVKDRAGFGAMSPDGRSLAYRPTGTQVDVQTWASRLYVHVVPVDAGSRATSPDTGWTMIPIYVWNGGPVWSPDGRFYAYAEPGTEGSDVYVVEVATGVRTMIGRSGEPPVWFDERTVLLSRPA